MSLHFLHTPKGEPMRLLCDTTTEHGATTFPGDVTCLDCLSEIRRLGLNRQTKRRRRNEPERGA